MDSNQRPTDFKSGALPTELRIPLIIHYVYVAKGKDRALAGPFLIEFCSSDFNCNGIEYFFRRYKTVYSNIDSLDTEYF